MKFEDAVQVEHAESAFKGGFCSQMKWQLFYWLRQKHKRKNEINKRKHFNVSMLSNVYETILLSR